MPDDKLIFRLMGHWPSLSVPVLDALLCVQGDVLEGDRKDWQLMEM